MTTLLVASSRKALLVLAGSIIIAAILGYSAARATEHTTVILDGAWWTGLSASEKTIAVQGMIVGFSGGFENGAFAASESTPGTGLWKGANWLTTRGERTFQAALKKNVSGVDRTFGSMIAELNKYFDDHPNRAETEVSAQVFCAITSGQHCEVLKRN